MSHNYKEKEYTILTDSQWPLLQVISGYLKTSATNSRAGSLHPPRTEFWWLERFLRMDFGTCPGPGAPSLTQGPEKVHSSSLMQPIMQPVLTRTPLFLDMFQVVPSLKTARPAAMARGGALWMTSTWRGSTAQSAGPAGTEETACVSTLRGHSVSTLQYTEFQSPSLLRTKVSFAGLSVLESLRPGGFLGKAIKKKNHNKPNMCFSICWLWMVDICLELATGGLYLPLNPPLSPKRSQVALHTASLLPIPEAAPYYYPPAHREWGINYAQSVMHFTYGFLLVNF